MFGRLGSYRPLHIARDQSSENHSYSGPHAVEIPLVHPGEGAMLLRLAGVVALIWAVAAVAILSAG